MTGEFTTTHHGPPTSSADGHHFLFRGVVFPHRRAAPVSIMYHRKRVIAYLEEKGVDLPITGKVHVQIEVHPSSLQRYDLDNVIGAIFQMLDGTTYTRHGVILESDAQIASVTARTAGPPGIDELVYRTRMEYERLPREEQDKMFEAYLENWLRDRTAQVDWGTEGTALHEIAVATLDRLPVSEIPEDNVQLKTYAQGEAALEETSCVTDTPESATAATLASKSETDTSSDTGEAGASSTPAAPSSTESPEDSPNEK